jgi:translation initiation factor 1
VEKRPRGKVATVIAGLTDRGDHLPALAAALKAACGSGGTVKEGRIELQGDHAGRVAEELTRRGYRVRLA